jgi:CheY-like chemotaxis protein
MEDARQKTEPVVLPAPAGSGRSARRRHARWLIFLIFMLCVAAAGQAADPYATLLDKQFAEPQASSNAVSAPDSGAVDPNVSALEHALKARGQRMAQGPRVAPPPPISHHSLMLAVALLLVAGLALRRITDLLERRFNSLAAALAEAKDRALRLKLIAEEPSMVAFFNALREGLNTPPLDPVASAFVPRDSRQAQTSEDESYTPADPLQEFFGSAPAQLARLRKLLSGISLAPDDAVRLKLLLEFSDHVRSLKEKSRLPEVLPIWLMAFALEGLLKQASSKPSYLTPSVLRTVAGALDLLETLCLPSLDPNLATSPPIRLLAVDDDAVCRSAISLALKKVFKEPDLAPEGLAALALAAQHTYDVIFMDVEMPGMDGFEVCSKIHETVLNRTTPVVFVTRHNDFNSRAKSSLSGGQELIAKPYLSTEITVKALMLALRGRLPNDAAEPRLAVRDASGRAALITATTVTGASSVIASSAPSVLVATPSGGELNERTEEQQEWESESNSTLESPQTKVSLNAGMHK